VRAWRDEYKAVLDELDAATRAADIRNLVDAKRDELAVLRLVGVEREKQVAMYAFEKQAVGLQTEEIKKLRSAYSDLVDDVIETQRAAQLGDAIGNAFGRGLEESLYQLNGWRDAVVGIFNDVRRAALNAVVTQPISQGISGLAQQAFGAIGFGSGSGQSARQAAADASRFLG
jgi:hypothetical protein